MMANKKIIIFFLAPVLVSFLLHLHVFNYDVIGYHAWRQSQTQTVIYQFSFSDNSVFNPQRFDLSNGSTRLLYEFPIYQWLIAQVNNAIGYSVMHTRLLSFLFFIFFLWGFYKLLSGFVPQKVALFVNVFACFSPLLYYYCVNPLPDLLALAFATWSLHFFFRLIVTHKNSSFLAFCFFLMLAALVKLPYILFGSVFILYAVRQSRAGNLAPVAKQLLTGLGFMIPIAAWYALAIPTWSGNNITSGIITNNKTILTLLDYFQFTVISTIPELITNYATCIFLVVGMYLFFRSGPALWKKYDYFVCLFLCFAVYYLFEMNMIEKTHDYYLMPFVPLVFLVVAYGSHFFYWKQKTGVLVFVACLVPLTAWLRIDQRWNPETPGFVTDYLSEQNRIQDLIPQDAVCVIDHDESKFIALYYLKRYGYSLPEHVLDNGTLRRLYLEGARYLVTEKTDLDPAAFPEFTLNIVFSKNLKIYKLELK